MQDYHAEIKKSHNIKEYVDFILHSQKTKASKKVINPPVVKDKKYTRITPEMYKILELELITKGDISMKKRKLLAD